MIPICIRAGHGGEEHADDLDKAVQRDDVRSAQDVWLAEGEDNDNDVEEDRKDKVEHGNPEKNLQAGCVRTWKMSQSPNVWIQ